MKTLLLSVLILFSVNACFGQKSSLSYDDLKFLVQNNLMQADTFMMAKGYIIAKKDLNTKNRKYTSTLQGNVYTNISIRLDGKKLFVEIETNELEQYNLIHESIAQFIDKDSMTAGVQAYVIKDLGNIYITVDDANPDPLKKDYDIQVVADKHNTAYN
jgi:predicted house-cleaning NTP pyrophosphatase (Maf/HAM1 superfamily)